MSRVKLLPLNFLLLSLLSLPVMATDELQSTLTDQKSISLTIYNDNLALVNELRNLQLGHGPISLAFRDVSAQIRPETVLLRSLSSPASLEVIEQSVDFGLLTPQQLLEKHVGQSVDIIKTNPTTGIEQTEKALILSADNGVILKIGDRIETAIPGRIVYHNIPANLRDRPTLTMLLNNSITSSQNVELSYLTSGLSWKADYVAELNDHDDKLDFSAWVTLTNTSGTSYHNAKIQLVAGNVNQVQDETPQRPRMSKMEVAMTAPRMTEESVLEYHLYSLEHPTTLAENQTKQIALLSAANVPVRKEFLLQGTDNYYQVSNDSTNQKAKIGIFIEFDNKKTANLGRPLPKGIWRVYKKNGSGNFIFVGEDHIDHTSKDETIRLKLGDAFDITAERKQTDFKKIPNQARNSTIYESAYELVLKNAKHDAITVTVQEPIPGDWKMLTSNLPCKKDTSHSAVWHVNVPAEGSAHLTYRVQVTY